MARRHVLLVDKGVVYCDECGERQENDAAANPKLNRPCEGFSDEHGVQLSGYKTKKEKLFKKYPMMRLYKSAEMADRARCALYGNGPYPPAWLLPIDESEE
jgi:hypothetical protein